MSKMKDKVIDQQNEQPEYVADLLLNGTTVLEAPTREALAELVDNIPADVRYAVGAVGRKPDGSAYTLRVDIIKN
jgi:hypothetical protein